MSLSLAGMNFLLDVASASASAAAAAAAAGELHVVGLTVLRRS